MKILGIDTATDVLGIAITENRTLIAETRMNIKRAHAEKLLPVMDELLKEVNLRANELEGIAVSIGPGSFTGLRIGLAAIKGLAFALNLPVVSVSTLDALVLQARFWSGQICPLIRAQGDEAYTALYQFQGERLLRKSDYQLIDIHSLDEFIDEKTLLINNGMKNLDDVIHQKNVMKEHIVLAPPELSMASGFSVAILGYEKFLAGEKYDINILEPFYLKNFKAKKKIGL